MLRSMLLRCMLLRCMMRSMLRLVWSMLRSRMTVLADVDDADETEQKQDGQIDGGLKLRDVRCFAFPMTAYAGGMNKCHVPVMVIPRFWESRHGFQMRMLHTVNLGLLSIRTCCSILNSNLQQSYTATSMLFLTQPMTLGRNQKKKQMTMER